MKNSKAKSIIIVVLAFVVILLGTCEVHRHFSGSRSAPTIDTISSGLYRQEKQQQIAVFEEKIGRLQQQKDSLWFLVAVKKTEFTSTRPKINQYQARLKNHLSRPDSVSLDRDSLRTITDSLIVYQDRADTACIETITALEQVVANRDSCISVQKLVESNLKDIQKEQDLKEAYLTDQLNTALKMQRKKARQNKILSGCILLLSGITTAVLVPHYLK